MGKQQPVIYDRRGCRDDSAPICGSDCCKSLHGSAKQSVVGPNFDLFDNGSNNDDIIHELLVIGAGVHSHALVLRLLSPEPDLLSDKERHVQAEYKERMRPPREVNRYLEKLQIGPKATLKMKKKSKSSGRGNAESHPSPLTLEEFTKSVLIVDKFGGWMHNWKENFRALRIPNLRSLMSAHNCPYDHRSLEYYAKMRGRGEELVTLPCLHQRDSSFKGPYQVPSTSVFNEFHSLLSRAYGIENAVSTGTVLSIVPKQDCTDDIAAVGENALFEVKMLYSGVVRTVKTRRVVCALGPMFRNLEPPWLASLEQELGEGHEAFERIFHAHQVLPFINEQENYPTNLGRILVVGGGITSAQLTLLASEASWCKEVTLITRSKLKPRHFDIENKWMGPKRGKLLKEFQRLNMHERAEELKRARGGGSVPPEIIERLRHCATASSCLKVLEEVEILEVQWTGDHFTVILNEGSVDSYDTIWLAIGAQNHIDNYGCLSDLREELPMEVVNGLPVLGNDLSWQSPAVVDCDHEPAWKQIARKRLWCMGALSALQLGPDALNIIGARQGSVRVARAIRSDFDEQRYNV